MIELSTAAEVIEALGGVEEIAKLTGRSYDTAWRSTRTEVFPAKTYLVMTAALNGRGYTAPSSLWRMVKPAEPQQQGETWI